MKITACEALLARDWLERSLFRTFDLREAVQNQGWSCNVVFFFNSFEAPTATMTDGERRAWWDSYMPPDGSLHELGGATPPESLDVDFLRSHVISAGAAFIDANQLRPEELRRLCSPWSEELTPIAESAASRLRLQHFFRPPLDELLLGTLAKADSLSFDEVELAPVLAERTGHSIAANTIATTRPRADVMDTLRELEDMKHVSFRRREVFMEADGKAVVQEWSQTAQESLCVRILREIRLPELLESLIRGLRG